MRILFTDTESTDLAASWGRILCCSYATLDGEVYTHRGDRRPHIGRNKVDDSKLVKRIRDEWEAADIIVTWYGILHDVPLLNARLAKAGERPCKLGDKHGTRHLDLIWYAGGQSMKIGGKKLDTVAKYFGCDNQKTPLDGEAWQLAAVGDKQAMDAVVEHCEADVLVLRDVFPHLAPLVKKFSFSFDEVWPHLSEIKSRRNALAA